MKNILFQRPLPWRPGFGYPEGCSFKSFPVVLLLLVSFLLHAQDPLLRVDCSKYWLLPTANGGTSAHLSGTSFNFLNNSTDNNITGVYNSPAITASNTINSTIYQATTITLNEGFNALSTTSSDVLLTNNCPCIFHGNGLAKGLILLDSQDDTGAEPYPNTVVWNSPDIWIRRNNDGGTTHQAPIKDQINYIKIRVTNKSDVASSGQETLTANWGPTSIMSVAKCGRLLNSANTSGLETLPIGIIQPGESAILTFPFMPRTVNTAYYQYTIQASINENSTPDLDPNYLSSARNSNKKALKNLTIVDSEVKTASVLIGSQQDNTNNYNLELLVTDDETGKPIYQEAEVRLKMDTDLHDSWQQGAMQKERMANTTEDNVKIVTGNNALLKGLTMGADFLGSVELDFNYLIGELTEKTNFSYHLVQHDATTDEIVGGCAFQIAKELRDPFEAKADDKEVDKFEPVTLTANDIGEQAIYNWYDSDGNFVAEGKDLHIASAVAEKYKLEVISSVDGFKDYTDVEVKLKPGRLISIVPNPAYDGKTTVLYKINQANSAYLIVSNYYLTTNGMSNNYIVDINATEKFIDLSSYPDGFYKVALVVDGNIVDVKILSTL